MRKLLVILMSVFFLSAGAQSHLQPGGYPGYGLWAPSFGYNQFLNYTPFYGGFQPDGKWHLTKYASVSAGYVFLGRGISYLSAPVGLQLSRSLNKNFYGFAGISAAPTVYSFTGVGVYNPPVSGFSSPGSNSSRYGYNINPRVEAGLMYINDARTFSISGSVSVERDSYPAYPVGRTNPSKQ